MTDIVEKKTAIEQLVTLMAYLRDPVHGCAWDRKQSLRSLTRHTLEEVYEVIDAIESGDAKKICEELGDLLFQVVFYARIAEEGALFDLTDVANAIVNKLLHRHPHIFPDGTLQSFGQPSGLTAEQVEQNWEQIKNAERAAASDSGFASVMDDVARNMPALDRAAKLQKRAASVGFDWIHAADVMAKLDEERNELAEALADADSRAQAHELGDLLFSCVNLARHLGIDADAALRAANGRFEQRFRYVESKAGDSGRNMGEFDAEQLDLWWHEAKQHTR
jgi:nucleoside triphosphate diphosphatase